MQLYVQILVFLSLPKWMKSAGFTSRSLLTERLHSQWKLTTCKLDEYQREKWHSYINAFQHVRTRYYPSFTSCENAVVCRYASTPSVAVPDQCLNSLSPSTPCSEVCRLSITSVYTGDKFKHHRTQIRPVGRACRSCSNLAQDICCTSPPPPPCFMSIQKSLKGDELKCLLVCLFLLE